MVAQPVGVSSFAVGDIRLTMIPDGYYRCDPLATFVGSTQADWDANEHLLDERGRIVMTMGALLVELPSGERALMDLGFGPRTVILADVGMEFWGGRLVASLASVGFTPDDIDVVLYSHLHLDHVGWTTDRAAGSLTFDRARHIVARTEWEHWKGSPGTESIIPHIPLHRLGTTDEVAKIIYVLCTDTASYVNGAEIHINGGQHV